ncbi:MAG TPA: hypothetical protein VNA29_07730 [Sphingomicrobium sp.]|nr:hypothetical protein [Sphingomicrobium sp.]
MTGEKRPNDAPDEIELMSSGDTRVKSGSDPASAELDGGGDTREPGQTQSSGDTR